MSYTNSYQTLDSIFYSAEKPRTPRNPEIFLWNDRLADYLLLDSQLKKNDEERTKVFSGAVSLLNIEPIALAYAGHQFGHFVPLLGDGRAHLIGEVKNTQGERLDIQLKGSGPTIYSRQGDGLCALGPAVREYVMSEALHAMGIPTTRTLSVVTTGDSVVRQEIYPGAVVTRIAKGHIRVGTFQWAALKGGLEGLQNLLDYSISRLFSSIDGDYREKSVEFIERVMDKQIKLVTEWMRVGFIHGVMNTDNTSISGETIDYGPCAMMGGYNPNTFYSSIDTYGRYAFSNQPKIAMWNLARLAEALLPLVAKDQDEAVAKVTPLISSFEARFGESWSLMMANKLGFTQSDDEIQVLVNQLLLLLEKNRLDYTQTFIRLSDVLETDDYRDISPLKSWVGDWRAILKNRGITSIEVRNIMERKNPIVIPRNHHMERVIQSCLETKTNEEALKFLEVLRSPYETIANTACYQDLPKDGDVGYKTFCGT